MQLDLRPEHGLSVPQRRYGRVLVLRHEPWVARSVARQALPACIPMPPSAGCLAPIILPGMPRELQPIAPRRCPMDDLSRRGGQRQTAVMLPVVWTLGSVDRVAPAKHSELNSPTAVAFSSCRGLTCLRATLRAAVQPNINGAKDWFERTCLEWAIRATRGIELRPTQRCDHSYSAGR
jgi:hypothetical protein